MRDSRSIWFRSSPVSLGDLNGDGRLDLVTANVTANSLSVLLNSLATPGTFAPAVAYALGAGSNPVSVAVGDINGDGRLDVVSANFAGNTASILLGSTLAAGTLLAPTAYATGANSTPTGIAIGDLNGNGRLDIATANLNTASVSVLLGAAVAGSFGPYTAYSAGSQPNGVAVADLNGDGRLDIVTANQSTASILLNGGTALASTPATAEALGVFLNPTHGSFTLSVPALPTATSVEAELRNVLGQVVQRAAATLPAQGLQWHWENPGLAAGVYTIHMQAGPTRLTKRLVVR